MTEEVSTSEWYNALALARVIASNDLSASNELLGLVDELVSRERDKAIQPDEASKIAGTILMVAIKLADNSRALSTSVSKLVGVI